MITRFKLFENINNNYNGIIYCLDVNNNSLPTDLYMVYIKDTSDMYQECSDINSIEAIKNDSFIISDFLEKLNVQVPYTYSFFIDEFKNIPSYGFEYKNNSKMFVDDVFLKELPKSKTTEDFFIIDVKKVRINSDHTYYFYSDEELNFESDIRKYNL